MRFGTLERKYIKELCGYVGKSDEFYQIRNVLSEVVLPKGTGIFVFSKDINDRPSTILSIDVNQHSEKELDEIYNRILFFLHLVRKLERLGYVIISEGRYNKECEYAIACFSRGISVGGLRQQSTIDGSWA